MGQCSSQDFVWEVFYKMDKNLREDIERLAQSKRLMEEEKMSTKNISGIIEVNESIEDKNELLRKLRRRLRNWRISLVNGVVVLIIILLYMVYQIMNVKEPEPLPEPEPVIEQEVVDASLYCKLECPQVDKNLVEETTIQKVALESSDWVQCVYKNKNYEFISTDEYPVGFYEVEIGKEPILLADDTIYLWGSLSDLMESQSKVYTLSEEDFTIPDYSELNASTDKGRDLAFGVFDTFDKEPTIFYSASTVSEVPANKLANIINPLKFEVVIYDDVDTSGVDEAIKNALSEGVYKETTDLFVSGEQDSINYIGKKLINAIKGITPKFEVTCKSCMYEAIDVELYQYYSEVATENGQIICTRGTDVEIPKKVINLDITDYEILYDELACAYYFGWY